MDQKIAVGSNQSAEKIFSSPNCLLPTANLYFCYTNFIMRKFLFSLCLLFLFTKPVFADDKFSNSYNLTYQVTSSGLTNVNEEITITNKVSDYYPSGQTFSYHLLNLGNIKVIDEQGEFEPEISQTDNITKVNIKFRTKNVGIGKQTKFTLRYQTTDLASLNGEVWQIIIPGINNPEKYDQFNLNLIIPDTFPEIQYASVTPTSYWHWDKNTLSNRGIVLIFGKNQYYEFNLKYQLSNAGFTPLLNSITIPPDTNYQKVFLESIKPKPVYSEKDEDGNWIFWYELGGKQNINIEAIVKIDVKFDPEKIKPLTKNEIIKYTAPQKFWDYQNFAGLSEKINNLKTVKEIYDFSVNSMTYNFNRLNKSEERFTAFEALKNPINSICTDFTNVFIALSRKNGIPAREVNGFGQTQSQDLQPLSLKKDILHAWPEYYDFQTNKWIMVDPTWENTTNGIDFFNKLDLNHVAFVIKGVSSEYPFPAGSYKEENSNTKNISEKILTKKEYENSLKSSKIINNIELQYDFEDSIISGLEKPGLIKIQNTSNEQIHNIDAVFIIGEMQTTNTINSLIPYEIYEYNFKLPKINFWEKKDIKIVTIINGKSYFKTIKFVPIYLWKDNIYVFMIGAAAIIISIIIFVWQLVKQKKRSKIEI
jgi:hypothetical protein